MKDDSYILFDNYLNKELSASEIISFEEKRNSDADFKQEFEIYKALETSLASKFENEEAEKELKKTISKLGSKYIKPENSVKKKGKIISLFNYKNLMVAASIALLIGFFLFNNGDPVYSDFSNHKGLELIVRGDNNEASLKAQEAFNSKNYKEALQQLTILSETNTNDTEIELYKGICFLELNIYVEADVIFDAISSGNSAFVNTATWYKALSMLKQEQFEACKYVLKTIPESADEYKQAQKLLKKL
jgi:thioredoxin-like negative regulator of GroEL